jgi:hypothetical protein
LVSKGWKGDENGELWGGEERLDHLFFVFPLAIDIVGVWLRAHWQIVLIWKLI